MMDVLYINSKPHVLLSEDRTRDGTKGRHERASRQRAASEAGFSSGLVAAKSAHLHPNRHPRLSSSVSSTSSPVAALSPFQPRTPASLTALALQSPSLSSPLSPPAPPAPPSLRSTPAIIFSSRPGNDNHHDAAAVGVLAAPHTSSSSPLIFGPGNNTTPETSLVGARGKSIPLDDSIAAHRTSALRELNSSFPSPVFRHRHTKSAGAQNTTYSQPVIVRTYTGPSHSPSTSAHYRPPSSSRRAGSRAAGSRRIPFVPNPHLVAAATSSTREPAANSSNNAQGAGWGLASSLFGMARSKGKKGSFIPWPWAVGADGQSQKEEAKLPPLEAFSYKGFMADLQTTTDIRSDLDRIAEICARSRYCLSDEYDSHMAPHGSGAGFASSTGPQQPGRSKGRRKGTSSPGGPTLQAVPSDDDESNARGHRRRRGGIGNGRRRSAAYGTLETIMSSSRSSEEDKTKKKSAADIAEAVRGRAARKALDAANGTATVDTENGEPSQTSRSRKSPRGKDDDQRGTSPPTDEPGPALMGDDNLLPSNSGPLASLPSSGRQHGKTSRRPKSTAFAHAVIGSSRQQQKQQHAARSESGSRPAMRMAIAPTSVPALLSEPALPQTSDGSIEIYNVLDTVNVQSAPPHSNLPSRRRTVASAYPYTIPNSNQGHEVHIIDTDIETDQDLSSFLASENAAAAGFFSGLTHWIPWMAVGNGGSADELPWTDDQRNHSQSHEPAAVEPSPPPGPSHAEGSLRELLKTVDDGKQRKGKDIDDGDSR